MRKPLLGFATILLAIPLAIPTAAVADDGDLSRELAAKCNRGTDVCTFRPMGTALYSSPQKKVGRTVLNCGPGEATEYLEWSETTGEVITVGATAILYSESNVEFAGLSLAYKVKQETTYSHKWGTSESFSYGQWVKVPPRSVGWVTRSTPMQRQTGTYELHFGKRFHGHYYWYLNNATIDMPAPDAASYGITVAHLRPMTAAEEKGCTR